MSQKQTVLQDLMKRMRPLEEKIKSQRKEHAAEHAEIRRKHNDDVNNTRQRFGRLRSYLGQLSGYQRGYGSFAPLRNLSQELPWLIPLLDDAEKLPTANANGKDNLEEIQEDVP